MFYRATVFCFLFFCAEVQSLQSSVLQLQEEEDQQRAQQKQLEQEKESQLTSLREKLLTQTQHLDSFQARVSNLSHFYSTRETHVSTSGSQLVESLDQGNHNSNRERGCGGVKVEVFDWQTGQSELRVEINNYTHDIHSSPC